MLRFLTQIAPHFLDPDLDMVQGYLLVGLLEAQENILILPTKIENTDPNFSIGM
ncbi:hypothetical protein [Risungbinella massiliensis]|uniref:hypothetical protein n=1 Tax=Risungbinella massiliensis TaxID=1329796 RepID=UPI0012B62A28|nr:hypothetical protein [Risungbinella massiliensis]